MANEKAQQGEFTIYNTLDEILSLHVHYDLSLYIYIYIYI